jgi:hypothetical protein
MLRFGGVYPGKFTFVHNSHFGIGFFDCPFAVQEFHEVKTLLAGISVEDMIEHINNVFNFFTPSEWIQYAQQNYVSFYDDIDGRKDFVKTLWDNNVMSVLRIPFFIKDDAVMRKWLYAYEGLVYMLKKPELEKKKDKKAVTDAMAEEVQVQKNLNNPRWKHVDADKDKNTPDTAAVGDTVMLMASASGFDNGTSVTFDIFDSSGGSPVKIDSVNGKIDGGRAETKWTIKDYKNGEKIKLEFEASAKSLKSGKYLIQLTKSTIQIKFPLEDPHKQFVNLSLNGSDQGSELKVKVAIKNVPENTELFWKLSAHSENSKRNDKQIGLKNPVTNSFKKLIDAVAKISTNTKGENGEVIVCCGVAGGDSFVLEIGIKDDVWLSKINIVNWRKLWYQVTRPDTLSVPALSYAITAYKKVFIELIQAEGKQFTKSTVPDRTYYKEWMLQKGGSDKDVAVIGSHNKDHFFGYYEQKNDEPVKAHLVICQHQWDEGACTKLKNFVMTNNISDHILTSTAIFSPPLSGNLVLAGLWSSNAPLGHPDYGKKGHIVDEYILIEKNRPSLQHIRIKIPEGIICPDKKNTITVKFILQGVKGTYLGESSGNNMLIVYDPKNIRDFNNTISHEIGHAINQVPVPGKQASSLPNHPRQYTGHGGIGSHCNTIKKFSGEQVAGKLNNSNEYSSGVCVMFHAGDDSCINEFCKACVPYINATDISGFHKS